MKGLINGCHKALEWTLPLVSSTPHSLKNKCWDAATAEAAASSSSSSFSSNFNKLAAVKRIYQLVFSTTAWNSRFLLHSSAHLLALTSVPDINNTDTNVSISIDTIDVENCIC